MSNKVPAIIDCAEVFEEIRNSHVSLRSIEDRFYILIGENFPKRVLEAVLTEGLEFVPYLDTQTIIEEEQNLRRELLGSKRKHGDIISINWGQKLAGILLKENYALVYTPLTGLMKFNSVYYNSDDTISAIVGCNHRRCTAVVWDPVTGVSSEHYIELNKPNSLLCIKGVCVLSGIDESVILRPDTSPIYIPLTPAYPLTSCNNSVYIMYRGDEGAFVIKVNDNNIDPLIPIGGTPSASCLNESLVICSKENGCGILRERLWISLTNRLFLPTSMGDIVVLNPATGKEVLLANEMGILTKIKSELCVPNNEGLILCLNDGYATISSVHAMIEPTIEVVKDTVDNESYALIQVRVPGKCSEVEVVGDIVGQRLEQEGYVHLYLRPIRLGDTATPIIIVRSPLTELARRVTITSSSPRLRSIMIERAEASNVGKLVSDPCMNAIVIGKAFIIKTSPGKWSANVIAAPDFKVEGIKSIDETVLFNLVGKSQPGAAIPLSFELIDEVGTRYVIPGTIVKLRKAKIDDIVLTSSVRVTDNGIDAPGRVRVLCADGKTLEPGRVDVCLLPALIESTLIEDGFKAVISKVISCTDEIVPNNFKCIETKGDVEEIVINGNGVLKINGTAGLTVICGMSTAAGDRVNIRLSTLDLVDGCRIYIANENPRYVVIKRDDLVASAFLVAVHAAKKLHALVEGNAR